MSITNLMFDRATVERDTVTTTDDYGHPLPPVWGSHITSMSCRVYSNKGTYITDGDKSATVEVLRIAYRLDADITDADRITIIKDRRGVTRYTGNFELKNTARKYNHFEADLKRVQ